MKPLVDLHTHSVYSDGTCSPEEICALAIQCGMQTIALSDHDTTDGLDAMREAVANATRDGHRIRLLPAIELSSGDDGLTHVLGYGIHTDAQPLQDELLALKRKRFDRNLAAIRRIEALLGRELLPASMETGADADATLGRMHVARLLIQKQVVRTVEEAFRKYLASGRPAYLPLRHMTTQAAIAALRQSGAVPVLAHPMRTGLPDEQLEQLILRLKSSGLAGMEVFHPSASRQNVKQLLALARKYDLLVTGGSDFHGDNNRSTRIGKYPSGWHTWEQDRDTLLGAVHDFDNYHTKGGR